MFRKVPGVLDTVVGYCGGTTAWPTYESIGDHTEALRVTFDPSVISYGEILRIFWAEHQPMPFTITGHQYKSAIYCHTALQRQTALKVKEELSGKSPFASALDSTSIEEAKTFYRAEEYHQQWISKQSGTFVL
ncbi:hypothetical protein AB1Y20_005216 [Prymnesium parvum]|uniref:peptide-methionine (S)-S-oxide reductase n=1 Tax=Prymnesium parvum TaxID=97485 RepID=A0AB34J3Z3_PRYPA|mmetsp:Transcript_8885/g.21980  ORF Transcript_8885/g.21980 Transcript_8885/m.21980 type:complete len:133 (+) Transcript_8885:231-629(+)